MFASPVLAHIIPFDGKFFDDTEQTITSLVTLNLIVVALFILCLISIRNGRKAAAQEARLVKLKQARLGTFIETGVKPERSGSTPNGPRKPKK